MKELKDSGVLIARVPGFAGCCVSLATWSCLNHVAFYCRIPVKRVDEHGCERIFSELIVFEMTFDGILSTPLDEYLRSNPCIILDRVPQLNPIALISFLDENEFREYDYTASFLWIIRNLKDINPERKYNCLDLVYEVWRYQGHNLWDGRNISPIKLKKELISKYYR